MRRVGGGCPGSALPVFRMIAVLAACAACVIGSRGVATADCLSDFAPAAVIGAAFGSAECAAADVNGDGHVGAADVTASLHRLPGPPPTATPVPVGPQLTFFGLANANGSPASPRGMLDDRLVYVRGAGSGFMIVVEGRAGASGGSPGLTTFDSHAFDPERRPDLQLQSNRPLGDGSRSVCEGGVPGFDPPDFGPSLNVADALNDVGCHFEPAAGGSPCTIDEFGRARFFGTGTQAQFCLLVPRTLTLPPGETVLSVRLRDTAGNLGPMRQMIIQISPGGPSGTFTPTPLVTATFTPTGTVTRTSTPVPTWTPTRTATVPAPSPSPTAVATNTAPVATATRTASASPLPSRSHTPTPTRSATPTRSPTQLPPATASPTRAATATGTPTRTPTSVPSVATPTRTATRTPTSVQGLATPTRTGTPLPATRTPTRTVTATGPVSTPTATRTSTRTASRTPTRTPTATPTRTSTPSIAATATPSRTATATRSVTPTRTTTPTRTRTATPTVTPTGGSARGPMVTYLGLVRADDTLVQLAGATPDGIPIYTRPTGVGFALVVEGRPGLSNAPLGRFSFNDGLFDFPDLQVQVSRPLGNGSGEVCDSRPPGAGGVPAISPPDFTPTNAIIRAVNDLGCRFVDGVGSPAGRADRDSCVVFASGTFRFAASNSTLQFCGFIDRPLEFPPGDTLVTVRLRDQQGNVGPQAQMIVRVGS